MKLPLWRRRQKDELEEEVRGHLGAAVRERMERGETRAEAEAAARRQFGNVELVKEVTRDVWGWRWLEQFARDVRIGLRSLLRAKGLAVTVVVTLALGIGANAAIFSVVRSVLLRPLVNRGEDRLVYIRQSAPGVGTENMTFSVPEINDLKARVKTIAAFGDFSTVELTMIGPGEPRLVHAGVVNGSFFEVMGLRPVLGRLLNTSDDGPKAAPAAVLTHRFWKSSFNGDPSAIGKTLRLGSRTPTIVGVLEPSVPYPADTEIIANMVTSPHHLGATMNTDRLHRMTDLFGRLAPGATVEDARAELIAAHAAMMRQYPEAYSTSAKIRLSVTPLRDQLTAPARPILLVLLAAAGVVFLIACSNVANLILARSIRREGELAVRAALGASPGALRRTLLAESLVLCGAGAVLGLLLAQWLVPVVALYAARFSIRALEVTVDSTLLWVGAGLAMAAAVLLAYVPRLPLPNGQIGFGLASGVRITAGTNRRLRLFAMAQIALSFVLLAGAGMLVAALIALQISNSGFDTRRVLAIDVPGLASGVSDAKIADFCQEVTRRIGELPGVAGVAGGSFVPWRDVGKWGRWQFTAEGYTPAAGEESPYARPRFVGPSFFAVVGIPVVAGREFTDDDLRRERGDVAIVSRSIAQRLFPNGDALNRKLWWVGALSARERDPVPFRIVGVVADVDDESVVPTPALTVYLLPLEGIAGRLFVRTSGDPYALVPRVTRIIRELRPEQAVERAATLEDVRTEVLAPERLNAFVVSGFAGIALLIAVVGVAGVLAFSVSARTREFGIRLAVGATPRHLLARVLCDGALIVGIGIVAGAAVGYAFASVVESFVGSVRVPGLLPLLVAAAVLAGAGVLASLMPAARAAHVDVLQALRSE